MPRQPPYELKLALFDLGGVLVRRHSRKGPGDIPPSAWTLIAEALGPEAVTEENRTKRLWNAGKYKTSLDWNRASLAIHKKHGLTRGLFEALMQDSLDFYPHVDETMQMLRENGVKTGVLSGGFQYQANLARERLGLDYAVASCDYAWKRDGTIRSWRLRDTDYQHKVEIAKELMNQAGEELETAILPEEVAYVGDGYNDVQIAKFVGVPIAFNATPKLCTVAQYSINEPIGAEGFKRVKNILRAYLPNGAPLEHVLQLPKAVDDVRTFSR